MKLNIQQISPFIHLFAAMVACTVKNDVEFLLYRVGFAESDEEPRDVVAVDFIVFPDNRFIQDRQVDGPPEVLPGTAATGFHLFYIFTRTHPTIRQFCPLRRMNAINKQDRFFISGFLFSFS